YLIAEPLKFTVGRALPNRKLGTQHYSPFTSENDAFPSGHTTEAFTLASVIAAHYDSLWVKIAAYGTASAVGWARDNQNQHFTSDVVAGALIGTLVGNKVVHYNQRRRAEQREPRVTF